MAKCYIKRALIGVGALFAFSALSVSAQVMQSSSYQIQSDSINVGGLYSTSSSYILEDTTGEIGTGESASASFQLRAGYQQMQEVFLALTAAANVVMTPSIGGVAGGTANGSTSVTATTDSPSGYQLTITSSTSPALQKDADSIADYDAGVDPDFTFTTAATNSHMGFSPEGTHIPDRFRDNGVNTCNTGSNDTSLACWEGLSTSAQTIARSTSPNHPNGTETVIQFRVGIGGSVNQIEGTYTGTSTITLLPL